MKFFAFLYAVIALATSVHSIRHADCRSFDRTTCRSFVMTDAYFHGLLWPYYWAFESRPQDEKPQ